MKNNSCILCGQKKFHLIIQTKWPIKKCLNCNLVQVNPLPSKKEIDNLYQGDYYKNFAPYFSQLKTHQRYFSLELKKIQRYKKNGRLLDLGCALGSLLIEAKKVGFKAEGIEISDYAVKYCRQQKLKAAVGTVFSIKKNNYYDLVTAFEIIEHERQPLLMLKKIFRLLKKNGLVVITTPNYDSIFRRLFGRFWIGYYHREHLYFFNQKTITLMLKKAGFKKIIVKKDIPRPYTFDYFFRRLADYIPVIFLKRLLVFLGKIAKKINFSVFINPWENIIVYAKK